LAHGLDQARVLGSAAHPPRAAEPAYPKRREQTFLLAGCDGPARALARAAPRRARLRRRARADGAGAAFPLRGRAARSRGARAPGGAGLPGRFSRQVATAARRSAALAWRPRGAALLPLPARAAALSRGRLREHQRRSNCDLGRDRRGALLARGGAGADHRARRLARVRLALAAVATAARAAARIACSPTSPGTVPPSGWSPPHTSARSSSSTARSRACPRAAFAARSHIASR